MHMTNYEDDLTVIKGIGPSRQRWLRESLDVRTFQDLAALSVDDVVSQLRAEGRIASSNEVEAWIEQAQQLASPIKQSVNMEGTEEQTNSPNDAGNWRPFASFVVEFQARTLEGQEEGRRTTAHYMEADTDARWPGIENLQLCRWMLEQIGEEPWPGLQQQLEDERAHALEELEQDLKEKRHQAEEELEQELERERTQARQELEQDLEEMRVQARQRLEEQLEEERVHARQELEQGIAEEQTETREALAQAQHELQQRFEEERAQALKQLEQDLEEKRRQAEEELEEELERERLQARQELQQELEEMRAQVQRELELPLEESVEEQQPAVEESEEERVQPRREQEEEPAIEMPLAEATPVSITITQIRAVQPPDAVQPTVVGNKRQQFYGFLQGDTPFVFEVDFELAESAVAEVMREGITYSAQFYVRDMSTGTKLHLGNTQPQAFIEDETSYTATLPDITLPSGVYRLSVLVTLQNRHPSADYYVMPVLQVA